MPTLSPVATSTSNKTIVTFAVLGGIAIAAMVFFGMSAAKKGSKNDMNYLTPGYWGAFNDIQYRAPSETPVIEEEKPRPIEPKKMMEEFKPEGVMQKKY